MTSNSNQTKQKYDPYPAIKNKIMGIQNQTFALNGTYDRVSKGIRGVDPDADVKAELDRIFRSAVIVMCLGADLIKSVEDVQSKLEGSA